MSTISQVFETLAERRAEHRKTRADLAKLRETHAAAGKKLEHLRLGLRGRPYGWRQSQCPASRAES